MARLTWDNVGERFYEAGVDRAVLFLQNDDGSYRTGVPWNGVTKIGEKPSGGDPTQYKADGVVYYEIRAGEDMGLSIEAYTYPDEFEECNGVVEVETFAGMYLAQQPRRSFGLAYRTLIGNDVDGQDHAYKLHLLYGASASPSERSYDTISDQPQPAAFSWDITTVPPQFSSLNYMPTALVSFDSRKISKQVMSDIEDIIYGTDSTNSRLPVIEELLYVTKPAPTITLRSDMTISLGNDFDVRDYVIVVDGYGKNITQTATVAVSPAVDVWNADTYLVTITATDPIPGGKSNSIEAAFFVIPATTLYTDGTLIFNETTRSQRTSNISSHGAVIESYYCDCPQKRYNFNNLLDLPWVNKRLNVTSIQILGALAPQNLNFWFGGLNNLISITGTENIDCTNVSEARNLFYSDTIITNIELKFHNAENITSYYELLWNCYALQTIDFSGMNFVTTKSSTNLGYMFENCKALQTIYVNTNYNHALVSSNGTTFKGCTTQLKGGAGTTWASGKTGSVYAKIDDPDHSNPGYFTLKS